MIQFKKSEGQRILEIGGGEQRHHQSDVNVDVRSCPGVDFTLNFEEMPWAIQSEEFDCVYSRFCLEHINWRKVRQFLKEVHRVTKPGGMAVFVVPNTEKQLAHIQDNRDGWDGRDAFDSASCILFGDGDYEANHHKSFWSPSIATQLFSEAGFENIITQPFSLIPGADLSKATDMLIQAVKPAIVQDSVVTLPPADENEPPTIAQDVPAAESQPNPLPTPTEPVSSDPGAIVWQQETPLAQVMAKLAAENKTISEQVEEVERSNKVLADSLGVDLAKEKATIRAAVFGKNYFHSGQYAPFLLDYPKNENIFRHVLARRPESVLEIGCGRGHVLKRLQDKGIPCCGIDVSRHCWLTRVMDPLFLWDVCNAPWNCLKWIPPEKKYDLVFSFDFLQHVPEQYLPIVFREMGTYVKRGLHGIIFEGQDDGTDPTRCTLKSKEWWESHLPKGHEVLSKKELEQGALSPDVVIGDGKTKLHIGCAWTQFHHGWENMDVVDAAQFAQQNGYKFRRCDATQGLPYKTGSVHLIFASHFLEHLSYQEGQKFLKECRRVIRPDGAMRLTMPDAELLIPLYERGISKWRKLFIGNSHGIVEGEGLPIFAEVNDNCGNAPTTAGKLWSILLDGHKSIYDRETLTHALTEAGWVSHATDFRRTEVPQCKQILEETMESLPECSIFADAVPKVG